MNWLGRLNSRMVRHYDHLHDAESRRQMGKLKLLSTLDSRESRPSVIGRKEAPALELDPKTPDPRLPTIATVLTQSN